MIVNNYLSILALHRMEFLKTGEKLILSELIEPMEDIFLLSEKEVQAVIGRALKPGKWKPEGFLRQAGNDQKLIQRKKIKFVFYWDSAYPPQLREIYDPPFLLFYYGKLPQFIVPTVAIVGTRLPSGSARSAAFQIGMELSRLGIDVVSGLAKGIDREAHEGSLEGEGCSLAVLGNGIDTVYPSSSRKTAERILEHNGAIISEYFPGTLPLKYHFPARNRLISGLSRSVVIIQAPARSGALITSEYALEQGRDIYVHKAGLLGVQGAGTRSLYEDGAPVIEHGKEILADWGFNVDLSHLNCDYSINEHAKHSEWENSGWKQFEWEKPGKRLAKMLEYELSGSVRMHNGEYHLT